MAAIPNPLALLAMLAELPTTAVRLVGLVEKAARDIEPLDDDLHDIHGVAMELKPEVVRMRELMEGFVEQAERIEVQLDALRTDLAAVPFIDKTLTGTEPSK